MNSLSLLGLSNCGDAARRGGHRAPGGVMARGADVTLLDSQSRAVSATLTLNDLRVVSGSNLKVYVDFPSSSILP